MKVANLRISPDTLISVLGLPRETEVEGIQLDFSTNEILVRIRHDELSEVKEGEIIPTVQAIFFGDQFLRFSKITGT